MKNTELKNESPIATTIITLAKDPVVKAVMIATACLATLYLAGFVFRIAAGTIREYKSFNAAIKM